MPFALALGRKTRAAGIISLYFLHLLSLLPISSPLSTLHQSAPQFLFIPILSPLSTTPHSNENQTYIHLSIYLPAISLPSLALYIYIYIYISLTKTNTSKQLYLKVTRLGTSLHSMPNYLLNTCQLYCKNFAPSCSTSRHLNSSLNHFIRHFNLSHKTRASRIE